MLHGLTAWWMALCSSHSWCYMQEGRQECVPAGRAQADTIGWFLPASQQWEKVHELTWACHLIWKTRNALVFYTSLNQVSHFLSERDHYLQVPWHFVQSCSGPSLLWPSTHTINFPCVTIVLIWWLRSLFPVMKGKQHYLSLACCWKLRRLMEWTLIRVGKKRGL